MNKAQKVVLGFIIVSVLIIAILSLIYVTKTKNSGLPTGIVFYYGADCPHCKVVEAWMITNNISSKLNITQTEVINNPLKRNEFLSVLNQCKIEPSNAGVPLLYSDGKCYQGEVEVIDFIKVKAGVN